MLEKSKKVVLMIDDDVAVCELVKSIVVSRGFQFVVHHRYDGSMNLVKKLHPDLVLLDLHLPDGSGLHLCQDIKKDSLLQDIPVVMLTTREFNIEREIALKAGAHSFINKPFDRSFLGNVIEEILSPEVQLVFWGVRGSTPCANKENMIYGGNTTCMQIIIPEADDYLIFDSGSGIRNLGNQIIQRDEISKGKLFITHPHWDHIQGFPFFKPFYKPENHFAIHMPQQLGGDCKDVLSGQMTYTYFPVTPEMLMAKLDYTTQSYQVQDYGQYKIEFMLANHPVATAIYKIYIDKKVIIFCPDNELVPITHGMRNSFYDHLIEFISDADILIHDGQYSRETYKMRKNWGHSAWEEAVELGIETRIKHLYLAHHDPDSTDTQLEKAERVLDQYRDSFESVHFAKEGNTVKLKLI